MTPTTRSPFGLPTMTAEPWQMSYGERAALEGLLAQVAPILAVEIGTAEGGSLKRIAAHSGEVHSFDLVAPRDDVAQLENVTFHTGDSHQLLGEFLEQAAADGRSIDFVLIDGDHSADGVRGDVLDVLASDAVTQTVIVLHDTLNPEVRRGIEAAAPADNPKVALYEPDLVPGYLARAEPYRLQLWGGLGLIVVDPERRQAAPHGVRDDRFHELFAVLRPATEVMSRLEAAGRPLDQLPATAVESSLRAEIDRQAAFDAELARLSSQRDDLAAQLAAVQRSRGWQLVKAARQLLALARRQP